MQNKNTAFCTIIAKNYLPFARCLMESLGRWHPTSKRIVVLADRVDGHFDPSSEDFDLILSEDLAIPETKWFHFKYSLLELSTGVKPYVLEFIFSHYPVERLVYFDPDIWIYSSLVPLLQRLERASILLTPHLTGALDDRHRPGELDILRSGAYNLGFIALAADMGVFRFLRWWQEKVRDHCVVDVARGLFVDQRWVDLVPGLFPGVDIIREPGFNVAYWNIQHRTVRRLAKGYTVNGEPLYFFHFSGFDADNPEHFSIHQNRYRLADLGDGRQLLEDYRKALLHAGYGCCKRWPYSYDFFYNGTRIPNFARPVHLERPELVSAIRDPLSEEGYRAFVSFWNEPFPQAGDRSGITRLAHRIYCLRPDVQTAMPDILGRNREQFLRWLISDGKSQYSLDDPFIEPIRIAVAEVQAHKEAVLREQKMARLRARLPATLPPVCRDVLSKHREVLIALGRNGLTEHACVNWLNHIVSAGGAGRLSRLAHEIYRLRPDVQKVFPDPFGVDATSFVRWFLSCAPQEFQLDETFLAPMRREWERMLSGLKPSGARPLHQLRFWTMAAGARIGKLRVRGFSDSSDRRAAAAAHSSASVTGAAVTTSGETWTKPANGDPAAVLERGVNLIGYFRSETGMGESARSAARALRRSGIPLRLKNVERGDISRKQDESTGPFDTSFPFPFNLVHINADQIPQIAEILGREFFLGRYNIAYWLWELEDFPERWLDTLKYFHEIWTPSRFCQEAFSRKVLIPVIRIPISVEAPSVSRVDLKALGIPRNKFLFLTLFDMLSVFQRKNPLGVLEAFKLAFPADADAHLVIKVNNGRHRRDLLEMLRESSAGRPVTIIDRVLSRDETYALIQACDCLVSLHRSEGFGLVLAEAMYLGKPVITTAYSGNMDFTNQDTAFLVSYRLETVGPGAAPYDENATWAEPMIPCAVRQMRTVRYSPDIRNDVATRGQAYVRRCLSPEAVGRFIRERLARIGSHSAFHRFGSNGAMRASSH